MLIDTHCHLVTTKYSDMAQVIADSLELGVTHMITQGTHRKDWQGSIDLAAAHPEVISSCLAVHPTDAASVNDDDMQELERLCLAHPQVAIGEAGLDYYWPAPEGWTEEAYRARQQELLEQHFALAEKLGLNISIHTRDRKGSACFDDTMAIARQFPRVRPVFHCFIGTQQQADAIFNELDGMISITGIVTFKKTEDLQAVVTNSPADRIMLETDAPYLSPAPYRGELNIPGRTRFVAEKIAELRGISLEEIAHITTENAKRFFRFAK